MKTSKVGAENHRWIWNRAIDLGLTDRILDIRRALGTVQYFGFGRMPKSPMRRFKRYCS